MVRWGRVGNVWMLHIKHHNGVVHQSGGLCAVSISIEGLDLNIKRMKCRHMFKNLLSLMQLFLILKSKEKKMK